MKLKFETRQTAKHSILLSRSAYFVLVVTPYSFIHIYIFSANPQSLAVAFIITLSIGVIFLFGGNWLIGFFGGHPYKMDSRHLIFIGFQFLIASIITGLIINLLIL